MKTKITILLTALILILAIQSSCINSKQHKRRGAPPEAYTACEGKSAGDTAQFQNRRGETMNGTCEEDNGKLILRPNHSKR